MNDLVRIWVYSVVCNGKRNLLRYRFFSEKGVVTEINYILVDYNCKVHSCVSLYLEVLTYI